MRKNGAVRDATTLIAEGVRFTGDIAGDGNVEVNGRLEGAVHIGGELRIGLHGVARADVVAARVRVDGRLEGRIRATQQVAIGAEGVLVGDVQGLLAVEEGGLFQGSVDVEAPDPAGVTMEAPPVFESQPGRVPLRPQRLERLERPDEAPRLRLPQRRRSATAPSADRETVITRKMPQVRADGSHSRLPTSERIKQQRPAPASHLGPPAPQHEPPAPQHEPPAPRSVTPPHPPRSARRSQDAAAAKAASRQLHPGDPVREREDLSDEWFEEEDYLLKDR